MDKEKQTNSIVLFGLVLLGLVLVFMLTQQAPETPIGQAKQFTATSETPQQQTVTPSVAKKKFENPVEQLANENQEIRELFTNNINVASYKTTQKVQEECSKKTLFIKCVNTIANVYYDTDKTFVNQMCNDLLNETYCNQTNQNCTPPPSDPQYCQKIRQQCLDSTQDRIKECQLGGLNRFVW